MVRVLAIDTSTETGSVAVLVDGAVAAEVAARVRAKHGETLLPHVVHVLGLAGVGLGDVELVAVGLGPGSFTGLRIGLATAKGLALGRAIPVVGVPSLRALARGVPLARGVVAPMLDAHKGEVYAALYRAGLDGTLEEMLAPIHALPQEAARRVRERAGDDVVVIVGDARRVHGEALQRALGAACGVAPAAHDSPRAADVALDALEVLARDGAHDVASLEPLYVRASDAKLPVAR